MFLRVNTFVGFVLVHVGFSASRVPAEGALGLNVAPEDGDEETARTLIRGPRNDSRYESRLLNVTRWTGSVSRCGEL